MDPAYLQGEVIVLTAMLRTLIDLHPEIGELTDGFERRFEAAMTAALPEPISEQQILGMREMRARLLHGLRAR